MRIYLIALLYGEQLKYRVIDIDSGEIKEVTRQCLMEAIKRNKWAFKNLSIDEAEDERGPQYEKQYTLVIKEGQSEIPKRTTEGSGTSRKEYILVSIDAIKNTGKLIKANGQIVDYDLDNIYEYGRDIAGIQQMLKAEYNKITQTPFTEEELGLLREINAQYESFILMTKALGIDCSFKYAVSGKAVILQSYSGLSKHAIIPKFINVIDMRAFHGRDITELSLNDGLQVIGYSAFSFNKLEKVDIPKTVTRICSQAFCGNNKLFKQTTLDTSVFKVYNKDTIISKQTF